MPPRNGNPCQSAVCATATHRVCLCDANTKLKLNQMTPIVLQLTTNKTAQSDHEMDFENLMQLVVLDAPTWFHYKNNQNKENEWKKG